MGCILSLLDWLVALGFVTTTSKYIARSAFLAQRTVPPNLLRFILLVFVQYTAHRTMHSARNRLQVSFSLIYCVFFFTKVKRYHLKEPSGAVINSFWSAACTWRPTRRSRKTPLAADEDSALDWNAQCENLLLFIQMQNIWPYVCISGQWTGPHRLQLSAHLIRFFHYRRMPG